MRRIVNTAYISKIENIPTGVWCTQFTMDEVMKLDIAALYALAMEDTGRIIPPVKSKKAQRNFVEFVCDMHEVKHTVSHGIDYLLNKIEDATGSIKIGSAISSDYIKPPRRCVIELMERNIRRGHSSHEENNVIAFELINGGWPDKDISFVFKSIYNEPAGEWGWYNDDPRKAGRQIEQLRAKGINRYSKDNLIRLKVCTEECACSE